MSRAIPSSAVRRPAAPSKPKSSILGAKKKPGLGAKKIDASALDFDEAEKKAREEAERKEKLGYDPDENGSATAAVTKIAQPETPIFQPTPMSPARGQPSVRDRSDGEVEKLGGQVRRLGFGQVGGGMGAKPATAPRAMGFGSVGSKPVQEGELSRLIAM